MKEIDFTYARESANNNRRKLAQASSCGCFYCLRVFEPKEIVWESDEDNTAMCPYCGIDAVIAEESNLPVTKAFLKKMREFWFTESE